MTFPPKQPEAVTRHWARQLTTQEIAEGIRRTLPTRVRLAAPSTLGELPESVPPVDAIATAA